MFEILRRQSFHKVFYAENQAIFTYKQLLTESKDFHTHNQGPTSKIQAFSHRKSTFHLTKSTLFRWKIKNYIFIQKVMLFSQKNEMFSQGNQAFHTENPIFLRRKIKLFEIKIKVFKIQNKLFSSENSRLFYTEFFFFSTQKKKIFAQKTRLSTYNNIPPISSQIWLLYGDNIGPERHQK